MRRVITGVGQDGRSCVFSDGGPESLFHSSMGDGPDLLAGPSAAATDAVAPAAREALSGVVWSSNGSSPLELDGARGGDWTVQWYRTVFGPETAARLHATPTYDVDVIVSGEIDLLLETGEVRLRQGDTVVIPGVIHGWRTGAGSCDFIVAMWSRPDR